MSDRIDSRLAHIRASQPRPFEPVMFGEQLEEVFRLNLLELMGDADRDITRIEAAHEQSKAGVGYLIQGYASTGTCRLWCVFEWSTSDGDRVDVHVVITKRDLEASMELFGKSEPRIGNRFLLARVYDLAMEVAVASGLRYIYNTPWNDRLKAIFLAMGFEEEGTHTLLELTDDDSLWTALKYVDNIYGQFPQLAHPWL